MLLILWFLPQCWLYFLYFIKTIPKSVPSRLYDFISYKNMWLRNIGLAVDKKMWLIISCGVCKAFHSVKCIAYYKWGRKRMRLRRDGTNFTILRWISLKFNPNPPGCNSNNLSKDLDRVWPGRQLEVQFNFLADGKGSLGFNIQPPFADICNRLLEGTALRFQTDGYGPLFSGMFSDTVIVPFIEKIQQL